MGRHHVVVTVVRETSVQSVTRLARLTMPDSVRQNEVVLRRVQQLPGTEEHTGKLAGHELSSRPSGAMQDQHGVAHNACRVPDRFAESTIVELQLGQRFTAFESECPDRKVAL